MRIAVAGTGYVGLSLAVLLAQHNKVIAVDIIPEKVELINNKKSPIQDEYIEKYLVEKELDLKLAASAAGEKNIEMIKAKELLPLTGYVHGGCSPIGMKKFFPTFLDESAKSCSTILFSAGKIGRQVELAPPDLAGVIKLSFAKLC